MEKSGNKIIYIYIKKKSHDPFSSRWNGLL
jgi:hypothetical protein